MVAIVDPAAASFPAAPQADAASSRVVAHEGANSVANDVAIPTELDAAFASRLARTALDNVVREYPNKLDHLLTGDIDVRSPSMLHPVFYGSYDWHSSVHMHWTLVTLLDRFPALPEADAIAALLDRHFTVDRIAGELAYLARPSSASFERPYGWAWLLKLQEALHRAGRDDARAAVWRDRLAPLADAFVARVGRWLPVAVHPSRAGSHANGAFALMLMLDYATASGRADLHAALVAKAHAWYDADRAYPVEYEIGSEDFLSNGLLEAVLMHRVLCIDATGREADCNDAALGLAMFYQWWDDFVPDIARLAPWLKPVVPSDRGDPRFSHIDGLNLSPGWCWSRLVDHLPEALQTPVRLAIHAHRRESLPHAAVGHYVGTHLLASFALLALGM